MQRPCKRLAAGGEELQHACAHWLKLQLGQLVSARKLGSEVACNANGGPEGDNLPTRNGALGNCDCGNEKGERVVE